MVDDRRRLMIMVRELADNAVVGVGGRARLVGKSTQRVDGVVATLRVPLAGDRTVE